MTFHIDIFLFRMSENDKVTIRKEKVINSNGEISIRSYAQNRLIGRGGFAKVYQVNCLETNQIYAAKIMPKSSLKNEVIMQKVIHSKERTHYFSLKLRLSCISPLTIRM